MKNPKSAALPVRMRCIRLVVIASVFTWTASPVHAALINLSLDGMVDISGASIGGVFAPTGSHFNANVIIDDSTAAAGRYDIVRVGYSLTIGSFTAVADWNTNELVASATDLITDPLFIVDSLTGEEFQLNLSGFGVIDPTNPLSWAATGLTGDIIIRGPLGFIDPNQLSGIHPYAGLFDLTVTRLPEPTTLGLMGIGLIGMGLARRLGR